MSIPEITNCPGTLSKGYSTYSPTCLRNVFNGRKVSHILPYNPPEIDADDAEKFFENRKRISISGVQEKASIILDKNKLRLTEENEQGHYILKPIPRDVQKVDQVPANEHLTMQIANQVYHIPTAANALIFFKNGSPAYITKRFDVKENGEKWGKEDFASLAGKTSENAGRDFKYKYSYESIADLIKRYVPAYAFELEKLFKVVVFNYLFSNGDAHLKNFSLIETINKDYILSPAYDLLNTRIHIDDTYMALEEGLFKNGYETQSFEANGYYAYDDFYEFGLKIGLSEKRQQKLLDIFRLKNVEEVKSLISRSFLSDKVKVLYEEMYQKRRDSLNYSMKQLI
jgi:serine/threonine-protein kinase HipA